MGRRTTITVVAALAAAASLGACGGGSGGSGAAGQAATVKVQDTAGVPSAFLEYGVKQGYFKKRKLTIKVKASQGGATVVPSVVSGDTDIGGSNVVSVLLAQSKNIPVKIIAPGTFTAKRDFSGIIVSKKSGITSPRDLEGKTLAVNTLKNVAEVTAKASLQKKGVDVSKVKLTELEFPDMVAAVQSGKVDAAFAIEPFVTAGLKAGLSVVDRPYVGTRPGLQIGCYFASRQWLAKNGDVAKRFRQGVAETAADITKDPAAFRKFLPGAAKIPPPAARNAVLPAWKAKSDPASIALTAELMKQFGVTKEKVDTGDALAE